MHHLSICCQSFNTNNTVHECILSWSSYCSYCSSQWSSYCSYCSSQWSSYCSYCSSQWSSYCSYCSSLENTTVDEISVGDINNEVSLYSIAKSVKYVAGKCKAACVHLSISKIAPAVSAAVSAYFITCLSTHTHTHTGDEIPEGRHTARSSSG